MIFDAERTLMVLDEEGEILTRIWCLYEAWQTSIKSNEALVLMSYGIDIDPLEQVGNLWKANMPGLELDN